MTQHIAEVVSNKYILKTLAKSIDSLWKLSYIMTTYMELILWLKYNSNRYYYQIMLLKERKKLFKLNLNSYPNFTSLQCKKFYKICPIIFKRAKGFPLQISISNHISFSLLIRPNDIYFKTRININHLKWIIGFVSEEIFFWTCVKCCHVSIVQNVIGV